MKQDPDEKTLKWDNHMEDLANYSARFEITLLECGPNKPDVIRLVREYRYLGFIEGKNLVENLPRAAAYIGANNPAEAERCKARFEALGAKVTMELHFPVITGPGYYDE